MSRVMHYDVVVVGAGASGLMAAGRAAERGKRVLLLEKNQVVGKKLSITGGGRCNILNADSDERTLLSHYGKAAPFLFSPFSQHGMKDSWQFFESKGLPLKVEANNRAFPQSEQAGDVVATLLAYAQKHGVIVKTGLAVSGLKTEGARVIAVDSSLGSFSGDSYIVATGGSSHPETGSTGEGLRWLEACGYSVVAPNPDLVPLVVAEAWVKAMSGKSATVSISFHHPDQQQKPLTKTGRVLFTHFGLSGPTILNAARDVKWMLAAGPVSATLNLFPGRDVGELRAELLTLFENAKNKLVRNALRDFLPAGVLSGVSMLISEDLLEKKVHSVSRDERHQLIELLRALPLTVTDTKGMNWSIISDGGVMLADVDTKTMRLVRHENLYVTGDVLNISRPSGGYSLQLCWTTGWVAGSHA